MTSVMATQAGPRYDEITVVEKACDPILDKVPRHLSKESKTVPDSIKNERSDEHGYWH